MTGKINIALIEKFILLLLCLKYRNRLSENKSFNLFLNYCCPLKLFEPKN